jgi:Tol biopolymer transport system component
VKRVGAFLLAASCATLFLSQGPRIAAESQRAAYTKHPATHRPVERTPKAYFSQDGKQIIFQSTREPYKCDQIFTMDTGGGIHAGLKLVSTGKGRTTCGYFTADGSRVIYASTHLGSPDCPPNPDRAAGYVWPLYKTFDIFSARRDGSDLKRLTTTNGYDAEATVSPNGRKIIFTSTRDNDIELYEMDIDGKNQKRLTNEVGYDGGAFYSQDSEWIVWRASRPKTAADVQQFRDLLTKRW